MIIQIYAMVSLDDARRMAELGVDHIGFLVGEKEGNTVISRDLAKRICEALPNKTKVMMPILDLMMPMRDLTKKIIELAKEIKPDILHISSESFGVEELEEIKRALPEIKLMRSIAVDDEDAIECAAEIERFCDYFLLDSPGEPLRVKGYIGSTGKPHDWSISREIVKNSSIPVILSGGLSPENVGEAIRTVKPDGVDACTSLDMNSEGRKDVEKVREFIENARKEEVE